MVSVESIWALPEWKMIPPVRLIGMVSPSRFGRSLRLVFASESWPNLTVTEAELRIEPSSARVIDPPATNVPPV